MKNIVLSESSYDYKYKSIFSNLQNIEVKEGRFFLLMKYLVFKKSFYHIRYIKYRGPIITFVRLFMIYFLSKISGSKIIWSCHNVYEHKIPSKKINNILRYFISTIASDIIVFHEDLLKYLPKKSLNKTKVACFGDFKIFIENQKESNNDFNDKYQRWLKSKESSYPNIVSISAAKRNNLRLLVDGVKYTQINTLIIAPNSEIEVSKEVSNIYIYRNFVFSEVKNILNTKKNIVGFIGHENISVPTSIYMFASYQIPVIAFNIEPINSIVTKYQIGIIIQNAEELEIAYAKIIKNYDIHKRNTLNFIKDNSWEKSGLIHKEVFK